jgi:LemA protein
MKNKKLLNLALFFGFAGLLSSCGVQDIPRQNNQVEATWAEVVNQYQRRSDLIPNLVEVVKGYAKQEKETLVAVMEARASATQIKLDAKDLNEAKMKEYMAAQQNLKGSLSRLMLVAENYPDLKSNQNFRDLQVQLEGTENRITVARMRYIEEIKKFNDYVTVFPTNLTNSVFFKFEKKPQFTVEDEAAAAKAPAVKF